MGVVLLSTFSRPAVRKSHGFALLQFMALLLLVEAVESVPSALPSSTSRRPEPRGTFFARRRSATDDNIDSSSPSVILKHKGLMKGGGKACMIYIWDFPSAVLSKWCHHLQRDCIYEGRGGKKFVRIEPGSMLQLLYPCSRYSTDRCWLCGGNFRDHLTLWWSKHLYTPFDSHVDQVYRESVVDVSDLSSHEQQHRNLEYAFHRRYVVDLDESLRGANYDSEKTKQVVERLVKQRFPLAKENYCGVEIRSSVPSNDIKNSNGSETIDSMKTVSSYAVPAIDLLRMGSPRQSIGLLTAREIFLNAVECVMTLERLDYGRGQKRQQ